MEADLKVCREVATHANAGTLDQISIPFFSPDSNLLNELENEERIIESVNIDGIAKADIFGDGNIEYVLRRSYRLVGHSFEYFDHDWLSIQVKDWTELLPDDDPRKNDTTYEERLIHFGQQIYILLEVGDSVGSDPAYLHSLVKIGTDHIQKKVCYFSHEIHGKAVVSRNRPLCQKVLKGGPLEYVAFDTPHSLHSWENDKEDLKIYDDEEVAITDIFNEGRNVYLINLSRIWANCDWRGLALLNSDRTSVDLEQTKLLDFGSCDIQYRPFVYQGKTYVEETDLRVRPSYPEITQVSKGRKETICKFKSWAVTIAP